MAAGEAKRLKGVATERSTLYNEYKYIVTIKNNSIKYTSLLELVEIYNWLVKRINGCEWSDVMAVELDKHNRLHIHGIFSKIKRVNPASYKKKGYSIHFQPIDNYDAGLSYISKARQNVYEHSQRDYESYASYNYLFINN